jgi:hypothetical protein
MNKKLYQEILVQQHLIPNCKHEKLEICLIIYAPFVVSKKKLFIHIPIVNQCPVVSANLDF